MWILDSIYIVGTTDVFDTSIFFQIWVQFFFSKKRKRTGPRFPVQFVQLQLDLELRRFQRTEICLFFIKVKNYPTLVLILQSRVQEMLSSKYYNTSGTLVETIVGFLSICYKIQFWVFEKISKQKKSFSYEEGS